MKIRTAFNVKKNSGLTLIELLIVIAILAILLLIGLMTWRNQFNKAKDASRKDDLQRITIAFEEYFNDNECYPPTDILDNCEGDELSPYLESIPCDPLSHTPYCYIPDITIPTCPRYYRVFSSLDYTDDPIIAKLKCHGDEYCGYETACKADAIQSGYNYGVSSLNVPVLNPLVSPPPASAPPSPVSSPSPSPLPGNLACSHVVEPKESVCNSYADPEAAGCPITFSDTDLCNAFCKTSKPEERCKY